MPTDIFTPPDQDTRSTQELIRVALSNIDFDSDKPYGENPPWDAISVIMRRGGQEEFESARALCASEDFVARRVGAHILGQLGGMRKTFVAESVDLLIERLSDADENIIAEAGFALGHRNDPRVIPYLLKLKNHPNPEVRWGVVMGLGQHEDERAVAALIELSRDEYTSARDWATFNLGSMIEMDTPTIREALFARLNDADPDTRGEAMIGLAGRRDQRAIKAIQNELAGEFYGSWAIEAAKQFADPIFYPLLLALSQRLQAEDETYFLRLCQEALAACQPTPDVSAAEPNA